MKNYRFYMAIAAALLIACTATSQPLSWTQYYNSSRPNILGLDATTGTRSIAFSPLNNDVYSFGHLYYGLPAVPSGLAWGKEMVVRRYDRLSGGLVNSVINTHHTASDTIPFLDVAGEMVIAADGSVYVTGKYYYSSFFSYDMIVVKYSASLTEIWRYYFYANQAGSSDEGTAIAIDQSGNICVAGYIGDNGTGTGKDIIVAKLYAAGGLIWSQIYNTNGTNNDIPADLATDNKGSVYVTGYSSSSSNGNQYTTIKFGSGGSFKWKKSYNGSSTGAYDDRANSIAVDNSSRRVFVTGTAINSTGNSDIATLCYDSLGNTLWTKKINNPGISSDRGFKVIVNAGHRVFVGGDVDRNTTASVEGDIIIRKYDADGNQLKNVIYNGSSYDCEFGNMVLSPSGNFYVTGSCDGAVPPPGHGFSLVKLQYNSAGLLQSSDILSPSQFQTCGEAYHGWVMAYNVSTDDLAIGGRHVVDCPGTNSEEWITRLYHPALRVEDDINSSIQPSGQTVSIFPVPAQDKLNIHLSIQNGDLVIIRILNIHGQTVNQTTISGDAGTIDISALVPGIYFAEVSNGSFGVERVKFIKE